MGVKNSPFIVVLVTASSVEEAEKIATTNLWLPILSDHDIVSA